MAELVHERNVLLQDEAGVVYDTVRVYASAQRGGTYAGWIEFLSTDRTRAVRSERETSQSTIDAVAYWATGLEPVFFEGALERALRAEDLGRRSDPLEDEAAAVSPQVGRAVRMTVETLDPELPMRLMGVRTLTPGTRSRVHDAGILVYEGQTREENGTRPAEYAFVVQFGSEHTASVMANALWSELHAAAARVVVDGALIPLEPAAIRDALLGVAV